MSRILWAGASLFIIAAFIIGVAGACSAPDPAPAEPTGIELDVDRAKPRPPLKQPKAAKGAKR